MIFFFVSGPDFPDVPPPQTYLLGHAMVNCGSDLVVIGGQTDNLRDSFYLLSAENGYFKWEKMNLQLKVPRSYFVAMCIPDDL